ncbi:ankyrin repeat domain-containing protein [Sphingomonas donggukensis]|uniref:Ankyrin repeat domain-containing protein n=1 Tax=Sphingomonas donggukensis TaxID=2949093 RepID=A0ABY4TTP2_9SPHN|nr:ankyrin repeat domain-containing protein [Sphingomonas donggukensis]URW74787.1 ankyrin repeat domain-containing protein [Sphingomonas donggukensis]
MRRMRFGAIALALAAAMQLLAAVPAVSAMVESDPFDDARHYVVNRQNAEALRLIDSGQFPIDQTNYEGWTLLHYAAEAGNLDMVKALLDRRADPTLKTKWGSTPWDVASATMVRSALVAAVTQRTGRAPGAPDRAAPPARSAPQPARASASGASAPAKPQSPRAKQCQARWYSSQALCSDSTCKMREYRKWQTCLKTGSYY